MDKYIRKLHGFQKRHTKKHTHNQSINNSLKQTNTVETFEHPRNPYVLSAPRLRSQSPSGLVSDFPIVALLALTVSIDRQVIKKSKLGNISSSGDAGALIRLVKKSGRAPFSFLIREVARPAHTIFTFVPSLPLLRTLGQNIGTPSGTGSSLFLQSLGSLTTPPTGDLRFLA